ncbi:hypothetical protein GCM10027276_27080 [Comamonas piscis]
MACKPFGLEKYIEYGKSDATIGASTAKNTALWFIGWRDLDGISSVSVYVAYDPKDEMSKNISDERLSNVSKFLFPLVEDKVKIEYISSPREPRSKASDDFYFNNLVISIQPKCIETQSCCGGNMR